MAVGASVRALLGTVNRLHRCCGAIDLFCDRDTRKTARFFQQLDQLSDIPAAMGPLAQPARSTGVVWAGGIENRTDVVDSMSACPGLQLLGCSASAMRAARDPGLVCDVLKSARLTCLEVRRRHPGWSGEQPWIVKPVRSAGGRNIRLLARDSNSSETDEQYYQEYVAGPVFGATLIALPDRVELIGVCRQLQSNCDAVPFRYAGSVGPLPERESHRIQLQNIGRCLSDRFGFSGWFGIDYVVRADHVLVLEINPRYTASMEILDGRAVDCLFARHLNAFGDWIGKFSYRQRHPSPRTCPFAGKRILYNDRSVALPISSETSDRLWALNQEAGAVRDVPVSGIRVPPGGPVCTLWAEAGSLSNVMARLRQNEQTVTSILK